MKTIHSPAMIGGFLALLTVAWHKYLGLMSCRKRPWPRPMPLFEPAWSESRVPSLPGTPPPKLARPRDGVANP